MKQAVLTIICLLVSVYMQAVDVTPIANAFKDGKSAVLATMMDREVDIAVPGVSEKGNPAAAGSVLAVFFRQNKPAGFTVVHHADKKENGFFVGKLPTSTGEYRVNVTYRVEGDKVLIQSIRIE
ncbi:MAG: DUF4783 domain-containing protein [Tannerellaceae bacterium]|nr:DUF4783 domain-containing protein [Tannerellaceae bacterium]